METANHGPEKERTEWYALHVKSRHEFVTNSELEKKGISTYLPSVSKWRQWKDRKKLVEFPLFPGYLFVHIRQDSHEYLNVLKAKGVVRFLSVGQVPTPVSHEEINSLKLLVESGEELDIYPHVREGTEVRVIRGLFTGAEGILEKKEAHCMFIVNVKLLGRSVGVKILADDIASI